MKTGRCGLAAALAAVLSVGLVSCGSDSETAPGSTDGGGVEAGPCEPVGTWTLMLASDAGGSGPGSELIQVEQADTGYTVTWLDRAYAADSCGGPTPPPPDTSPAGEVPVSQANFDSSTCTLSVALVDRYCFSGEGQCLDLSLTLGFSGDAATGSALEDRGWCQDSHETELSAVASRN